MLRRIQDFKMKFFFCENEAKLKIYVIYKKIYFRMIFFPEFHFCFQKISETFIFFVSKEKKKVCVFFFCLFLFLFEKQNKKKKIKFLS